MAPFQSEVVIEIVHFIATHIENHEDTYELSEAESHTKFKRSKCRNHGSTPFPGEEF